MMRHTITPTAPTTWLVETSHGDSVATVHAVSEVRGMLLAQAIADKLNGVRQ